MKIKISFFSILMFASLIFTKSYYALIPLSVAILHELGHILCAKLRRVTLKCMDIGIFGARITLDRRIYSYADEMIVCIGGPAANIVLGDIVLIVSKAFNINSDTIDFFLLSSFSLGAINLLPIKSFDGGRMLFALLAQNRSLNTAERILSLSSFLSLFVLWSISLYLLLRTSSSLSLFIFSIAVFATIFV